MYMVGLYVAYWLVAMLGAGVLGFWASVLLAALIVGVLGAIIELLVLRRVYAAPELFQLLATFAVVLIVRDGVLWLWGAEDLFGPRAPGFTGAVQILGRAFPEYDLLLIVVGPLVLLLLWLLLRRTRFGLLIRAATQDREMLGALGVNQAWLFTAVFALGSGLAALGGALQLPREPASLGLDLSAIGDAFVVVVVGGMGSIPGAFLAALLIAEIKAVCYGIGTVEIMGASFAFSKLTMVVEFMVMAAVLIWRPWGLLGRAQEPVRATTMVEEPMRPLGRAGTYGVAVLVAALLALPIAAAHFPYATVLAIDVLIAVLFATSLHFIMGPGGMTSFGHAAYFGLGAYGVAMFLRGLALPMEMALLMGPVLAVAGAVVFGWFAVRLSGVYLAMLTLAFGQIVWSVVFQWDEITGGSNGLVGLWPSPWLESRTAFYYLTLVLVAASVFLLRRILLAPLGYAMRAGRDAPLRAEATGIDVARTHWLAFVVAGAFCGLAGALFAFAKGTISPETISVSRSIDALVMVLLGGVQTLSGPIVGGAVFVILQDTIMRATEYWSALLGLVILALVLLFPQGIAGGLIALGRRLRGAMASGAGR